MWQYYVFDVREFHANRNNIKRKIETDITKRNGIDGIQSRPHVFIPVHIDFHHIKEWDHSFPTPFIAQFPVFSIIAFQGEDISGPFGPCGSRGPIPRL